MTDKKLTSIYCCFLLLLGACDLGNLTADAEVDGPRDESRCPGPPEIPSETVAVKDAGADPATRIVVDPGRELGEIEPGVYGVNHRYPYAGFGSWDVDNNEPFADFVANLRYAGFGVLRFPGGRMANLYRWKRAIGPLEQRRESPNGGGTGDALSSEFGPDEFGRLMDATGAGAVVVANFATGSPKEAADWIEYMNSPVGANPNGGKDWAAVRAENGSPEPYGVRLWEVGNELNSDKVYWMGEKQTEEQKATKYTFGGSTVFRKQMLATLTAHSDRAARATGDENLVRYVRYPPVRPGSDRLYVDRKPWERADDVSSAGKENVYSLDPQSGKVTFGDGENGNIPPEGALLTMDYDSGPHPGFLDFYRAMKEVDPTIRIGSAIHSESFTRLMGAEHPYDMMVVHTYGTFQDAPTRPGDLHDYLMLVPDEQRDYIEASQRQVLRYAGAARAEDIDVALTEYAANSGVNRGVNSIDAPDHYLLSLDGALYTALLIRHWIELGIPLALKHSLIDSDPDNPPEGYTRGLTADSAVIGPPPCFISSATAHVFRMYTHMLGPTRVAAEIGGNPARTTSEGRNLEALVTLATTDAEGRPALLVINRDRRRAVETEVVIDGWQGEGQARIWTLTADSFLDYNTEEHPNRVHVRETLVQGAGGSLLHVFPPHSVTTIRFEKP